MKTLVALRTYRGGAAQRWQRLSGKGSFASTRRFYFSRVTHGAAPSSGSTQRSPV